ncbi:hypothetical protein KIW84_030694 [Lathyrus oleraceus]|uniref:Uncharacterized protein n=1 Tax=Pisum sativum TaxID=3888 RepID=A0A9D4XQF9_PEA|nr:hypothetical protein KIW84_030694 [Pisum sativum]
MDFNINDSNNYQLVYEDQKHVHGLRRMDFDSNLDILDIAFARGYVAEVDNGAYHNKLSRYQCEHGGIRQTPSAFSIQLSSRFSDGCDQKVKQEEELRLSSRSPIRSHVQIDSQCSADKFPVINEKDQEAPSIASSLNYCHSNKSGSIDQCSRPSEGVIESVPDLQKE